MSLEFEREDVVQKLCAAYARDQLTTGELEARLERVYKSADRTQLLTVLDGLPAMRIARLGEMAPAAPNLAPPSVAAPPPGTRALAANEKRYAAFMSEIRKEGAWTVTPRIKAKTLMGAVILDFRETAIPADGVDIDADVIMGSLKVILPPGLPAEVDCSSFMGSVHDKSKAGVPGAPMIRVTGNAVMGDITVITKVPRKEGESAFRAQMRQWLGG